MIGLGFMRQLIDDGYNLFIAKLAPNHFDILDLV